MKSILIATLVFYIICGCTDSSKNSNSQVQKVSVPAHFIEQPHLLSADTIKNYTYMSQTPEEIKREKCEPIPELILQNEPSHPDQQFTGLEEIYHAFEKKSENFKFDCISGTQIICEEGTRIIIPENAFVYAMSGLPVKGEIDFRVREYYKMEDILLSKLSCNTTETILETGGMIYLEAYINELPCKLAPDKQLAIEFVGNTTADSMQIFDGEADSEGDIIWELQYSNLPDPVLYDINNLNYFGDPTNKLYTTCGKMPEFKGGNIDMRVWVNSQLKYPQEARDAKVQGQILVSFIVTDSGTIRNIQIEKRLGFGCDEIVVEMLNKMPAWQPGFENDVAVDVKIGLPIAFILDEEEFLFGVSAKDSFVQKGKKKQNSTWFNGSFYNDQALTDSNVIMVERALPPADTFSTNSSSFEISYALMYSIKIGWINCDRFINLEEPKTNYTVSLGMDEDIDLTLVFDNYNSVMRGKRSYGSIQFNNVLMNEPVTLFGIKNVDGQFYYCLKRSTTSNTKERNLQFIPATKEELKAIAATLNKPVEI